MTRMWKVRMMVLVERKARVDGVDRELSNVENAFSYT